jgi:hypothetical protein
MYNVAAVGGMHRQIQIVYNMPRVYSQYWPTITPGEPPIHAKGVVARGTKDGAARGAAATRGRLQGCQRPSAAAQQQNNTASADNCLLTAVP